MSARGDGHSVHRRLLAALDAAPAGTPLARRELLDALGATPGTDANGPASAASAPAVGWALSSLRVAGLVTQPARGHYALTAAGQRLLADPLVPAGFGPTYLTGRFPAVKAWRQGGDRPAPRAAAPGRGRRRHPASAAAAGAESAGADDAGADAAPFAPLPAPPPALTDFGPEERIEAAWREYRAALADELLARLRAVSPARFEVLVVDLLVRMGYGGARPGAGVVLGGSGDGGVDGVIHEDPLGLEAVYLQAKQQQAAVGRPELQAFVGALEGRRARKGVFLTTGAFTRQARAYVTGVAARVVLLDGAAIVELMLAHGVGLAVHKSLTIHTIDPASFAPVDHRSRTDA